MRAGRRTQVVKGAVCKTAMQRFDPARRLQYIRLKSPEFQLGLKLIQASSIPRRRIQPLWLYYDPLQDALWALRVNQLIKLTTVGESAIIYVVMNLQV